MELGDRHLKVHRASIGVTQAGGLDMGVSAMSMFAQTTSSDLEISRVIQLLNMVTAEELMDNEDYEGKFPTPAVDGLTGQKSARTSATNARSTVRLSS